jgi:phosphoribosyl-ATP pyrophosphohydrolase
LNPNQLSVLEEVIPKDAIKNGVAVPKIKSLKVTDGIKCDACKKCFGAKRSFQNHLNMEHDGDSTIKYFNCSVQRLQNFPSSPYFSIKVTDLSISKDGSVMDFNRCRELLQASEKESLEIDDDHAVRAESLQVNQLFLDQFLKKYNEEFVESVLNTMKSVNKQIQECCENFLLHINDALKDKNLYIRRCIQKFTGSTKVAFSHLQELDTVKAYSRVLYRSIMCMADLEISDAKKVLQERHQVMSRIYGLLYSILTQKITCHDSANELIFDKIFMFLCMKSGRVMRKPGDITKDMSAWKFILKGTALLFLKSKDMDPKGFCSEYLSLDEQTNFDLVSHKKAILSSLARQCPFVPRIQYNLTDPSVLTIDGHTEIRLGHVRNAVERLAKVISNKLTSACPKLDQLPGIEACKRDLTGIHEEGYSFISDEVNNFIDSSTLAFINIMGKLGISDPTAIDEGTARLFLNHCATLNADLLTAVHFTCGYPFRGPEYESMLIQDSYVGHRSVLILTKEQRMVIVGRYSKTRNMGAPESVRPKLLPIWLSQMLFKYLLYIRPAER